MTRRQNRWVRVFRFTVAGVQFYTSPTLFGGTEHGPKRWPQIGWFLCTPVVPSAYNNGHLTRRLWLYAFGYAWYFEWDRRVKV